MRLSFVLFLIYANPLLAGIADNAMELAQDYFEADDYDHARIEYEGLLSEEQDHWKNEILEYNIATVLLANKRVEEALTRFQKLAENEIRLPLLQQKASFNLMLARIIQLKSTLGALKGQRIASDWEYTQAYFLILRAIADVKAAELAWCRLESFEGAEQCLMLPPLLECGQELERLKHQFLEDYQAYSLTIKEETSAGKLQRLLFAYGMALMQDPLQKTDFVQISEKQGTVGAQLKKTASPLVLDNYAKSQKFLGSSIFLLGKSQTEQARLYAEIARFYLREAIEGFDPSSQAQSERVLKNGIVRQEFLLLLEQLRRQILSEISGLAEADKVVPELQKSVTKAGDDFLTSLLAQQKEAFDSPNNGKNRCQCHPWGEVIPPFSQGYSAAELAYSILQGGGNGNEAADFLQKAVVDQWNEALARMKMTSEEAKPPPKRPEKQKDNQSKENSEKEAKSQEVFRLVQDMENDDRSRPAQIKTVPAGGKGEPRPW